MRVLLGVLSLLLTLASPTIGAHCVTWTTSDPEVDAAGMYVDNDPCQPDCLWSIWTYMESNGIPGLQRGDEMVDDTCHHMIEADSFLCALLPMAMLAPRRRGDGRVGAAALVGVALVGATAFLPTAEAC